MAEEQIVQNLIRRLGQSQPERHAVELDDHFVDVDERDPHRMAAFANRLASCIRYYGLNNVADGNWEPFFRPADTLRLLEPPDQRQPPHLALFGAFLKLYEESRSVINRLTAAHMTFFYEQVLGFKRRPALPDRAHVIVELKNNTAPVRVGPEHRLTAGKGPEGERLFKPVTETIVRPTKVASLRAIFVDGGRTLHAAPVANSADGLGGEWESRDRHWSAFGSAALPEAPIGFGVASPVLRMAEGRRAVACAVQLDHVDAAATSAASLAFDAYMTGLKGWLGPYRANVHAEGAALVLGFTVPDTDPAVVDYDADLHGLAYSAEGPVVQFLLRIVDNGPGLDALRAAVVRTIRLTVTVSGIKSLGLESDLGPLDPKRAFMPFGPLPVVGSRFVISYPEALSKKLSELNVRMRWLGVPEDFGKLYQNYDPAHTFSADEFRATIAFHDGGSWTERGTHRGLFTASSFDGWYEFAFSANGTSTSPPPPRGRQVHALQIEVGRWARGAERATFSVSSLPSSLTRDTRLSDRVSLERFLDPALTRPKEGVIVFTLGHDFLHTLYRERVVANAYAAADKKVTLSEPYTPTVQTIELSYTAFSGSIDVSSTRLEDFSNPDVQFFHVDPFGQRRDHGYRRARVPFVVNTDVPLLPEHPYEGEFLIGLEGVEARDSVSLLVQVAEATADPDLPAAIVEWSALCDNDWKALRPEEVVSDRSNQLRRSGVVSLIVPKEATTDHTLLPAGMTWLRAVVGQHAGATCRLVAVIANAVEVEFTEPTAGAGHLSTALPPGSIAKLKTPLAGVKGVQQPYASFGGRPQESASALSIRASERLRHKDRCISPWDYERLVLEKFPGVHRVKCVPHARDGAWLAPGHVLLVVVPDLRDRGAPLAVSDAPADPIEPVAVDLLQPRVDIDSLTEIQAYVQERCGPQIAIHVKNPLYQKIRLSFHVKFTRGSDFHYHRLLLSNALIRFLSPWAFDAGRPLTFGGRVYRSVLLDFVEEQPYVDYLTSFNMFSQVGLSSIETPEAVPARPDAIFVSDVEHAISEVA